MSKTQGAQVTEEMDVAGAAKQAMDSISSTENDFTVSRKKSNSWIFQQIIEPILEDKSVLQKNRNGGVDYPFNASSGSCYTGINAVLANQIRLNTGRDENSPDNCRAYMKIEQIDNRNMGILKGSFGVPISFWMPVLRYQQNIYPQIPNPDGTGTIPDYSKGPIHRKGEPKLDGNGVPVGPGNEITLSFNMRDINQDRHIRKNKETIISPQGFKYDFDHNPGAIPGAVKNAGYTAKDSSTKEYFLEVLSKYFNSIYSGGSFEAAKFTPEQKADLKKELDNIIAFDKELDIARKERRPMNPVEKTYLFEVFNDATNIGMCRKDQLEKNQKARNEKRAAENENTAGTRKPPAINN